MAAANLASPNDDDTGRKLDGNKLTASMRPRDAPCQNLTDGLLTSQLARLVCNHWSMKGHVLQMRITIARILDCFAHAAA